MGRRVAGSRLGRRLEEAGRASSRAPPGHPLPSTSRAPRAPEPALAPHPSRGFASGRGVETGRACATKRALAPDTDVPLPPASFTCFTSGLPQLLPDVPEAQRTRYRVDQIVVVSGSGTERVRPGDTLWRIDGAPRAVFEKAPFIGSTQHLVYTDIDVRSRLVAISSTGSGPTAVLIPIRKSNDWWALAQDQRHAHFRASTLRPGHVAIGERFATCIYRRLYHARYLPGSDWDFLTYFEFSPANRAAFIDLLAQLRDPRQNPEWRFVEEEIEIWMTKQPPGPPQ